MSNPYAPPNELIVPPVLEDPVTGWDMFFGILLLLCVVLTLLVGIGIATTDPGGLIPFAIMLGPAYIVTMTKGLIQMQTKGKAKPANLFLTFLVSVLATASVASLLVVASIVMLFIYCISSGMNVR